MLFKFANGYWTNSIHVIEIVNTHIKMYILIFYYLIEHINCFLASSCEVQAQLRAVVVHDDVIKSEHFPRYWAFVRGIHRSQVNSPHKGQWRGALMFSLICSWTNVWVNNRDAGDYRRNQAHYDVIVMNLRSPAIFYLHHFLLPRNDLPRRLPLLIKCTIGQTVHLLYHFSYSIQSCIIDNEYLL